MKIRKLIIKSYRHLGNLEFDFTYPEGHEKAGMPLDKVCLIGQSATGKTSILELLKENFSKLGKIEIVNGNSLINYNGLTFDGSIEYLYKNEPLLTNATKIVKGSQEFPINPRGGSVTPLFTDALKLFYFTSEIISRNTISVFNRNPVDLLNDSVKLVQTAPLRFPIRHSIKVFSQEVDLSILYSLLINILDYRKKFTQMASELINKGAIGDINRLNKRFLEWASTNENPLIPFAESFNPILEKLNLEIDLINTEYPIPIKYKQNDDVIPISKLSTGTQGLLLSLFPLFQSDTSDAVILIDEPERSLFPDLQVDLISHYQQLAPNAQFFIATHSPFIAAAFEPEERFILYFDKKGKVAIRKGESPIGDDPNDMLQNDFKVDFYNRFGKEAYRQYMDLKQKLMQEEEPSKKKELLIEVTKLGDKYNF